MGKEIICLALLCLTGLNAMAQVGINSDGTQPDNSAMLDVKTTGKGILLPRMTFEQRNSILSPVEGLMVFCTNCNPDGSGAVALFQGGKWKTIDLNCLVPGSPVPGTHIPSVTQITWHWNPVPGATGYKWNTSNDYSSATDLGNNTSTTETGLSCGTSYTRYVWAYNSCGLSTETSLSQTTLACFSCGQSFTDGRDGKVYNTVLIGSQCWMAQNLNTGTKISISLAQTNNNIIEKYCYDNSDANCDVYGGLYQWAEMVQYLNGATINSSWDPLPAGNVTGICPAGWHLPADDEWTTLVTFLGGESVAGGKMKEAGLAHWAAPNTAATNSSGFTLLPGGAGSLGSFFYITQYTFLWSATQALNGFAWYRDVYNTYGGVDRYSYGNEGGFSVRCIQN